LTEKKKGVSLPFFTPLFLPKKTSKEFLQNLEVQNSPYLSNTLSCRSGKYRNYSPFEILSKLPQLGGFDLKSKKIDELPLISFFIPLSIFLSKN